MPTCRQHTCGALTRSGTACKKCVAKGQHTCHLHENAYVPFDPKQPPKKKNKRESTVPPNSKKRPLESTMPPNKVPRVTSKKRTRAAADGPHDTKRTRR